MAIFKKKETLTAQAGAVKKSDPKKEVKETAIATVESTSRVRANSKALDLAMVLIRPHVTEKATDLSEKGVYAFEVNKLANKMHVQMAVEQLFKVKPVKVAIVNESSKYMKNPRTGRMQVKKAGGKKALVYLKSGDKIEFV